MRFRSLSFTLALLVLLTAAAQTQTEPPSSANDSAAAVRTLERQWLDAYEQRDEAAMDRIVAADFVITFPDGSQQTKGQIMEMIRRMKARPASMRFYTEDVKAAVYGDTVILRGRVATQSLRDNSIQWSSYTDTYMRRDGKWQVVASHLSNAKMPAAAP